MNETGETIYDKIKTRLYEMIVERIKNGKHVLDVGCGECKLTTYLAKATKSKVIGIDINDNGFAKGRSDAERLGVSDLVKCMKVDARCFASVINEKMDMAVSMYAFHEFEKTIEVIKEVNKVLKPGGKILIIDFIKGSTAEKLWSERYYTPEQIKGLLKEAGFNELETEFPEAKELVFVQGIKKE